MFKRKRNPWDDTFWMAHPMAEHYDADPAMGCSLMIVAASAAVIGFLIGFVVGLAVAGGF